MGRAGVRMSVVGYTPACIQLDPHVWQTRLVKNSTSYLPLFGLFGSELRHHDDWHGAACASQVDGRAQHFARDGYAAFDCFVAAVGRQKLEDRQQPPTMECRQPDKARTEVRPVIIQVSIKEQRRKQRDHCYRPSKMRQLCL